jgi:hypothetical protein
VSDIDLPPIDIDEAFLKLSAMSDAAELLRKRHG